MVFARNCISVHYPRHKQPAGRNEVNSAMYWRRPKIAEVTGAVRLFEGENRWNYGCLYFFRAEKEADDNYGKRKRYNLSHQKSKQFVGRQQYHWTMSARYHRVGSSSNPHSGCPEQLFLFKFRSRMGWRAEWRGGHSHAEKRPSPRFEDIVATLRSDSTYLERACALLAEGDYAPDIT